MDLPGLNVEIKERILSNLRDRNADAQSFTGIILLTNTLLEGADYLKKENLRLKIRNERLEQENASLRNHRGDNVPPPADQLLWFEKKIFELQEELTQVHRKKGEYAQLIIDLRTEKDEKERELNTKAVRLNEIQTALAVSQEACRRFQRKAAEAELNHQSIKDEYDALLLAYSTLEEKKQALEKEHQDVIYRWMAFKERDADRLNAETEKIQKLKQAQLQRELEEAAREPVDSRKKVFCTEAVVPKKLFYKFIPHDGDINAAIWSLTGTKLITGGGDRKVKLWDIKAASHPVLRGIAHECNCSVMSLDFDSEEKFILASSCDFASRVWNMNDLKIRHTLTGHSGKVMSAKFFGGSTRVVSGSHDRTLKIWDLRRRACVCTIFAYSSCNDIVTCSGDENTIISGHLDKRIRFWDLRCQVSKSEILLQGRITSLDISNDGFSLLSCSRDDALKFIDLRMNQVLRTFSADGFVVGCDWARAKFSPDGQYVIAGSQDGSLYIWVLLNGKVEKVLRENSCTITTCSWSPDGQRIISCDRNKNAVIWSDF